MKWTYVDGEAIENITCNLDAKVHIMPDIKPYKSMIDGSMITSRSKHRKHLRDNNCIEVGNESMSNPIKKDKGLRKEALMSQLSNMTHAQANKILSKLRDDVRFSNNPHREK